MRDERMRELLRRADAGRDGAEVDVGRVRGVARRRVRRRVAVRVVEAMVICIGVGILGVSEMTRWGGRKGAEPVVVDPRPMPVAEVVDVRALIADRVQAQMDHRRARAWAVGVDPADPAAARDEAARTMVLVARARAELVNKQEARDLYERTIALFPETQWAVVAQQAVHQLEKAN